MKKIISVFLLVLISTIAFSMKKIGSYSSYGKKFDVYAAFNYVNELNVYVSIDGATSSDNVQIILEEENLNSFKNSLKVVYEKYNDWSKIADENNVTEFTKEIDVDLPPVEFAWYTSQWNFSKETTIRHFLFSVRGENKSLTSGGKVEDYKNEYMTQKWYLMFNSPSELQGLINILDFDKIKTSLAEEKDVNQLFK